MSFNCTRLLLRQNYVHPSSSIPTCGAHGLCRRRPREPSRVDQRSPPTDVHLCGHPEVCRQDEEDSYPDVEYRHLLLCNLFLALPSAPAAVPLELNRRMWIVLDHSCHSCLRPLLRQSVHLHCQIRRIPGRTPQTRASVT